MIRYRLDHVIAIIGLFAGLGLLLIAISIGKGIGISSTVLLSCLAYLVIKHYNSGRGPLNWGPRIDESKLRAFSLMNTVFLSLFLIVSVYSTNYSRPPEYFLFPCALSAMIGLEIYWSAGTRSRLYVWSTMIQILLLSAALRWGRVFEFSGLVGGDWYHAVLTSYIVENGHVIPSTYSMPWMPVDVTGYRNFPLMHVMASAYSLVTAIGSYREIIAFSIGAFEIASLVFVFLIGRKVFADERLALLSALILGVSNRHVFWGIWIVPQSLGLAFFAVIVYLFATPAPRNRYRILLVSLLMLFAIILAHTVSSFITVLTIFLFYLCDISYARFTKSRHTITWYIPLLGLALLVLYWAFFSNFLDNRVESLFQSLGSMQLLGLSPKGKSYFSYEVDNIGGYVFYTLGIIGSLTWLGQKRLSRLQFRICATSMALLALIYALWLTSMTTFLPDRWFPFLFVLLVLPAAEGLRRLIPRKRGASIVLLLILCSFTYFMVMNGDVNDEAPLIGTNQVPAYSYLDSEMLGARWADHFSRTPILTDQMFDDYFWSVLRNKMTSIDFENFVKPASGLLVIRNDIYERPTASRLHGNLMTVDLQFQVVLLQMNRIYSNGDVGNYLT